KTVYVSNGTNNAIGVIDFPRSKLVACIPTGWYPAGLVLDAKRGELYVANVKGTGSRNVEWKGTRKIEGKGIFGYNSHDYFGRVSLIRLPDGSAGASPSQLLAEQTKPVRAHTRT